MSKLDHAISLGLLPDELIVDNFAGGGGASLGIEMALGRSPDIAINHDAEAIAMHSANHPDTKHYCEDVWQVNPVEACAGRPVGLAWFSPDCFPAGTLILTDRGYRRIEEIEVGELVLTHRGRWRHVTDVMTSRKATRVIRTHGHPGLRVSDEHPVYARRGKAGDIDWVRAGDIERGHYVASPSCFRDIPPPELPDCEGLWWIVGKYLAEGWTRIRRQNAEMTLTVGKHEAAEIGWLLELVTDLRWSHRHTATACQYTCHRSAVVQFLRDHFGHLAQHKTIPGWVLSLPEAYRRELLASYMAGDGWTDGHLNEATTVSKSLAFGIKALAQSLGHTACVYVNDVNGGGMIGDRKITPNFPAWRVRWRNEPCLAHRQTWRDELHEWCPVREVIADSLEETVYNISVMEDESYVAEGIVVHNCKHFSKAKGGKPVSKKIRGLAWIVVKWAKAVSPRVIILENVEEFRDWGPLDDEGMPCRAKKGQTFQRWLAQLRNLGYVVEWRELRACDYSTPTIRKRLFVVARRDGQRVAWPEPTHGNPRTIGTDLFSGHLKPWRTAAECIDWSIPCPSIFGRKKPLAENTLRRVAAGLRKFVIESPEPFVVSHHHDLAGSTLIQIGYGERDGQAPRVPGLGKPLGTVVAGGAKHALVSAFLAKHYGTGIGSSADGPVGTATSKNKHSVVTSHLVKLRGTCRHGQPVTEPLATVSAQGTHLAEVRAFLVAYYGNERDGGRLTEPMRTTTSKERFGLVTIHGEEYVIADIGLRMLTPRELYRAQGFPDEYEIAPEFDGKPLTKTAQVRMCGNSVCPPNAAAVVRAQYGGTEASLAA